MKEHDQNINANKEHDHVNNEVALPDFIENMEESHAKDIAEAFYLGKTIAYSYASKTFTCKKEKLKCDFERFSDGITFIFNRDKSHIIHFNDDGLSVCL